MEAKTYCISTLWALCLWILHCIPSGLWGAWQGKLGPGEVKKFESQSVIFNQVQCLEVESLWYLNTSLFLPLTHTHSTSYNYNTSNSGSLVAAAAGRGFGLMSWINYQIVFDCSECWTWCRCLLCRFTLVFLRCLCVQMLSWIIPWCVKRYMPSLAWVCFHNWSEPSIFPRQKIISQK